MGEEEGRVAVVTWVEGTVNDMATLYGVLINDTRNLYTVLLTKYNTAATVNLWLGSPPTEPKAISIAPFRILSTPTDPKVMDMLKNDETLLEAIVVPQDNTILTSSILVVWVDGNSRHDVGHLVKINNKMFAEKEEVSFIKRT